MNEEAQCRKAEEINHAYMHANGVPHEHAGHTHSHTQTRAVVNRLEIGRASWRERVSAVV